jgi:hypothetical protein
MRRFTRSTALLFGLVLGLALPASALGLESLWLVGGSKLSAEVGMLSKSIGKIKLEDSKLGVAVECLSTDKEKIGSGPAGKTETFTLGECTSVKGCSTIDAVSMVNLPWKTIVVLAGSSFFQRFESKEAGKNPGFLIECTVAGILVDDTCTRSQFLMKLTNEATDDDGAFSAEEGFNCTLGGAETGLLSGTEELFVETAEVLAVSEA